MRFNSTIFTLALTVFSVQLMAQCTSVSFTAPDSACSGAAVNFGNTPAGGYTYEWDFCTGDLNGIPTGINSGVDPNLSFPQQGQLIKDNGNYYLFVVDFAGIMVRYDFGNSMDNIPAVYNYGSPNGNLFLSIGVDLIKDNGVWFALVANYNQRLTKIELGNDLTQNIAIPTDLGQVGLSNPRGVKAVFDGTNYYAFITNEQNDKILRVEFGNSMSNAPLGVTAITDPSFGFTWGIDMQYDCVLNKWIGFAASYNNGTIKVLDFGSSPGNTPTVAGTFGVTGLPSGLKVIKDGQYWYALVVSNSALKLESFRIGTDLLQTNPTMVFSDTVGLQVNPRGLALLKDSSLFHGYIINGDATKSQLSWPQLCGAATSFSGDPNIATTSYIQPGYQSITLSAFDANGLLSSFTDSVYINAAPVSGFTSPIACNGTAVQFTDTSSILAGTITGWSWDFGDLSPVDISQNPSHLFPGTGNYDVKLVTTSSTGCADSVIIQIVVNALPNVSFSNTPDLCSGYNIGFSDLTVVPGGNPAAWNWNFGDTTATDTLQNPSHIYQSGGNYTVTLAVTSDAGCIDSVSGIINILDAPVANYTVAATCSGSNTLFTNNTVVPTGLIVNYQWDFGDTGTSSQQDPAHQYLSAPGNYDVMLIALGNNGCNDTTVQNIRISGQPTPAFVYDPPVVCVGNQVDFTNTSSAVSPDTIMQYIWDFGDGFGDSIENPFHAYADTGFYNVTLTVVSPTYCDSSITLQVHVIPSPSISFTAAGVCNGLTTSFNPLISTPPGTAVDSIVWDFGDNTTLNSLSSPTHLYAAPGVYYATATVYNDLLCTGIYGDSVYVYDNPVAAFTNSPGCSGSAITFDGTGTTINNDSIVTYLWDMSGLGTLTGAQPTFTFQDSGFYQITLVTISSHGCSDTTSVQTYVVKSPQFTFTYTEPCFGQPATFVYVDSINPPQPANLLWNFGDGDQSSALQPIHLYAVADTFNVSLTVYNPNTGCTAIVSNDIVNHPLPDVDFNFSNTCQNQLVNFTDITTIATGNLSSWYWSFGDMTVDSVQDPVHAYTNAGNFGVTLNVVSNKGCAKALTDTITIYPEPIPGFTQSVLFGSPPLFVDFTNTSTGAVTYSWAFGDGDVSNDEDPSHVYSDTGTYIVTMTAASNFGCIATANGLVSVLIPYMDLAVEQVYFTQNNGQVQLTALIINKGNVTVSNFEITGLIEDGTPILESWQGNLVPGASVLYKFTAVYVTGNYAPAYVCASVDRPNGGIDNNYSNNSKCTVANASFDVFTAFPNPFADQMNIAFNLPSNSPVTIKIYDALGKLVYSDVQYAGVKGYNKVNINTTNLTKGTYAVTIDHNGDVKVLRAIKL